MTRGALGHTPEHRAGVAAAAEGGVDHHAVRRGFDQLLEHLLEQRRRVRSRRLVSQSVSATQAIPRGIGSLGRAYHPMMG